MVVNPWLGLIHASGPHIAWVKNPTLVFINIIEPPFLAAALFKESIWKHRRRSPVVPEDDLCQRALDK
jgi:hypothetical protein